MIYALSLLGSSAIGSGWILQHRAAVVLGAEMPLLRLIRSRLWWTGIAVLTVGRTLTGTALQSGPITLVAPPPSLSRPNTEHCRRQRSAFSCSRTGSSLGTAELVAESFCLAVMVASVVLIGRSPALQPRSRRRGPRSEVSNAAGWEP